MKPYLFSKKIQFLTIGYKLAYEDEKIEEVDIFNLDDKKYDLTQPFVLLLKRNFEHKNQVCEDVEFETERGMITKKYKRHLAYKILI